MTKKGFTLIELLAVIVVLAIIALIVTPVISKLIGNTKEQSNMRSVEGHITNVVNNLGVKLLENNYIDGIYSFNELGLSNYPASDPIRCQAYKVKGGKVVKAINCNVSDKNYRYDKQARNCMEDEVIYSDEDLLGPTLELASSPATYIGIAYLNPTNFERTCSQKNLTLNSYNTTTDIKEGCMKWYIYSETDTTYTMISDHNVYALQLWGPTTGETTYANSDVKPKVDELVSVYKWEAIPRLISGNEIYTIIGQTKFAINSSTSKRTFDSNTFDDTTRNKYAWLFDNTSGCKSSETDYGCEAEDNHSYLATNNTNQRIYGYWTSDNFPKNPKTWSVLNTGKFDLISCSASSYSRYYYGIRPVITVDKDIFSN